MRQLFLILVVLGGTAVLPPFVFSQDVGGGIVLGANIATLRAAESDDLAYRTAASGGLFTELGVAGPLTVRGELLFSQKGTKIRTEQGELTLKANYLELPVLLVGQLPFARTYHPHVVAGPALALKLYERQGAPGFSVSTEETAFERTDAGVMVGAGASLGGPQALQLEVRYTLGLRDVTRSVTAAPLSEMLPQDGTNGVWAIVARIGL